VLFGNSALAANTEFNNPPGSSMEELLTNAKEILVHIVSHLTNPDAWRQVLEKPQVFWAAFLVANLIVFTETGLLIGFFLPGDSLLVTLGIVAQGYWTPAETAMLTAALCFAAVFGDTVGYWIGVKAGPRLFQKEKSFFFRKDYLLMAEAFYTRHGGKTIIIARFIPIIRTFAPVVAGIAAMPYRRFLAFNLVGGISWIISMILFGYTLHLWAEPLVNKIAGWLGIKTNFKVERNIDAIVIVIVLASVLPLFWKGTKSYLAQRKAKQLAAENPTPTA